jgi:hypothetical protein
MALRRPKLPEINGDDSLQSPNQNTESLLGSRRGTDETKRIETDDDGNTYVHVAKDTSSAGVGAGVLNNGAVANVVATTLTTIVTYTAPAAKGVTRVSCSGTNYAKFSLVLNTTTIEYKRSGPDRNVEFGAFALSSGDVLDVKVEHYVTGDTADFEATIWGV